MKIRWRRQISILLCLLLTCSNLYVGNISRVYAQNEGEGVTPSLEMASPYDEVYVMDDDNVKGTEYEGKEFCQIEYGDNWEDQDGGGGEGCYQATDHWTDTSGAICTITFVGTNLKFYSRTSNNFGAADFSLDGGEAKEVSFWSGKQTENVFLYDTGILDYGEHVLTITAKGLIVVDRVEVSSPYAVVNDAEEGTEAMQIAYTSGSWHHEGPEQNCEHIYAATEKAKSYRKDVHWADGNASLRFPFYGTSVKYYTEKKNSYGKVSFSIDGTTVVSDLAYNVSGDQDQALLFDSHDYGELAPGLHTLEVSVPSGVLVVDRIEVCCSHKNEEEIVKNRKAETCTEAGYSGDTCYKYCGQLISEGQVIPEKGHSWDEGIVKKEPTTTETGEKLHTCNECGETYTETLPVLGGCQHRTKEERSQEATCTEPGYTGAIYCTDECKEMIYPGVIVPAKGHDEEVRNAVEVSSTEDGYTGDTYCKRCGELLKQGEVVPKAYAVVNDDAVGEGELQFDFTGNWTYEKAPSSAECYEGDNHWSDTADAAFTFKFKGTSVKYYGQKANNLGIAAFSIDNGEETEINMYQAQKVNQVLLYQSGDLEPGEHTLKVRVTGKNGAGNGTNVVVADRIEVYCNHKGEEVGERNVAATCTEAGSEGETYGMACGQKISDGKPTEPLRHEEAVRDDRKATCTEPGFTGQAYCTRCHEILREGEEIPASGHKWNDGVVTKEPTEEETGEKLYTCSVCGENYTETLPVVGGCQHRTKEERNQEATCTEPGYTGAIYCTDECKEMLYPGVVIPARGHDEEIRNAVEASGTQDGYSGDVYCKRCDELIRNGEMIPKAYAVVNDDAVGEGELQFDFTGDWVYEKAPSSVECYEGDNHWSDSEGAAFTFKFKGTSVKYYGQKAGNLGIAAFSIDNGEETEINMYQEQKENQVLLYQSGDLEPGEHTLKVRVTGKIGTDNGTSVVVADRIEVYCNHKGEEVGERNVAATCTEAGSEGETYGMACGQKISDGEPTEPLGHEEAVRDDRAAACTEPGFTGQAYCTRCHEILREGEEIPALGHKWNDGVVTKEPTEKEEGEKTFTCNVCEAVEIQKLPKKVVTPSDGSGLNPSVDTPKKGEVINDVSSNASYRVLSIKISGGKVSGSVTYVKPKETSAKTVRIPSKITVGGITYTVTAVADRAFCNNRKVTKVVIGSNVTTIGSNAFSGCKKLKTVTIGKNVATIGANAFSKCTALTKITIPSKVKKIGKQAFSGCKKLKTITVRTTKLKKSSVGSKAFQGIHAKAAIKVPKSKVKSYKGIFRARGAGKKTNIKKI